MRASYGLQDGYRDILTNEAISFHTDIEPWSVRITPKNPGSTFSIPPEFLEGELHYEVDSYLEAVDFGTGDFYQYPNIPSEHLAGEVVILYFTRITENHPPLSASALAGILSQATVLHDAFPPMLDIDNRTIVVDSVDFTAPNGIINGNLVGNNAGNFSGSTFKVAPRIFGDIALQSLTVWGGNMSTSFLDRWTPFYDCPNLERIEYQGDLGPYCTYIGPSNFVYIDENGYERVDAYPGGGRPSRIMDAIGPLTDFQMDSGSRFPIWDTTDLALCINPVVADKVTLPTRSAQISLPIGPDTRPATKMKVYQNGIKQISRGVGAFGQTQEVPLVFGLKLLGIYLPESLEHSTGAHLLERHQMKMPDGTYVGVSATPNVVKTLFNFSLGNALEEFWGSNDEELLMPLAGPNLRYLDSWGSAVVKSDYTEGNESKPYYWITLKQDGTLTGLELEGFEAPAMRYLGGWLEKTYSYGRTGPLTFSIPNGLTYEGTVRHKVPAPPHHEGIIIRNHRKYMASYISGTGFTHETSVPPSSMQLAYGKVGLETESVNPVVVLNMDENWLESSAPEAVYFKEMIAEESWNALNDLAQGRIQRQASYEIAISVDGFDIEPFDTSGLAYAISWEEGVFFNAQVDPTSIANILTPIDISKVEGGISGAYRYALHVSTPLREVVRFVDQYTTSEPSKSDPMLGSYIPSYTMILGFGVPSGIGELYTYDVADIDIPSFLLTDTPNQAYDTWNSIFSYLIYGDIEGFKTAHGISPSINVGGSSAQPTVAGGDYLGLGVLNWISVELSGTGQQISIPASLQPDGRGQRGFGVNLFREEIPYYPDQWPLYGDPIFIAFGRVGPNYVWSDGDVTTFREAVRPITDPLDPTDP